MSKIKRALNNALQHSQDLEAAYMSAEKKLTIAFKCQPFKLCRMRDPNEMPDTLVYQETFMGLPVKLMTVV